MMGDKQVQSVGNHSSAHQANRDINIHQGLQFAEVTELFAILMESNFPKMVEAVRQKVEKNVFQFARELQKTAEQRYTNINKENWVDPDVHAMLISALNASGRKGEDAHPSLLSELILSRVSNSETSFRNIVMNEAVEIIPKLTKEQIEFLSLYYLVMNVLLETSSDADDWEPICEIGIKELGHSFALPYVERQHLMYTGATTSHGGGFGVDLFVYLEHAIKDTTLKVKATRAAINDRSEFTSKLLKKFDGSGLPNIGLTAVGQVIAIANLMRYLPDLKYTIFKPSV